MGEHDELGAALAAKMAREERLASIAADRRRCPWCDIYVHSALASCICDSPCEDPGCPMGMVDARPPVPRFHPLDSGPTRT